MVSTIDGILGAEPIGVLKLDVEGFELEVLQGAEGALVSGKIRHILLEEHHFGSSRSAAYLNALGYHVFVMSQRLWGPELRSLPRAWSAPAGGTINLLATRFPDESEELFRARGWQVLRRRRISPSVA